MKPAYVKSIAFLMLICITFSCHKNTSNNNISCNATYSEQGGLQADGVVEYTAGATTAGTKISTLQYQDSAGITTVVSPALPFSRNVNLKKGSAVSITALTSVNTGDTIYVSAYADGSEGITACP